MTGILTSSTSYSPTHVPTYFSFEEPHRYGLRPDQGLYQWKTPEYTQSYEGQFFIDNLHGEGTYKWNNNYSRTIYEGHFYANDKEGYGNLSYPDGSIYEGLFKKNKRYGPGVFTYPNGRQDVGLWEGTRLIKLSTLVLGYLPRLAVSTKGKIKLLRHRKLIAIKKDIPNIAWEILNQLNASPEVLEKSDDLYSPLVSDQRSLHFNTKLYHDNFYDRSKPDDLCIEVIVEDEEEPIQSPEEPKKNIQNPDIPAPKQAAVQKTQVVPVTHLVAWNNTEHMTDMLIHVFKNRNFEDLMSYNIEWLVAHCRNAFHPPGMQEKYCVKLLELCSKGNKFWVPQLLAQYNINPDVSDAYGNSGLMFAAAKDHLEIIDVLLDEGADVNHCNDEGFTALSLCLTRYLAIANDIKNWEKAFLPPEMDTQSKKMNTIISQEWHKRASEEKLEEKEYDVEEQDDTNVGSSQEAIQKETIPIQGPPQQNKTYPHFAFNLDPLPSPLPPPKAKKPKAPLNEKKSKKKIVLVEIPSEPETDFAKVESLKVIQLTVKKLLQRGANPDYSDVPRPPLILAIYAKSEDLVSLLLQAGANHNITTLPQDGQLTPLHIVTLMAPCEETVKMCELLLQFGADPNIKMQDFYNKESDFAEFDGEELSEDEEGGKSALHALSMRPDANQDQEKYLCNIAKLIADQDQTDVDALYLGHSPLSLAIVRGNVELLDQLLQTNKFDPNQRLANKLGVAFSVLLALRFAEKLPLNISMQMCDVLMRHGADPLMNITRDEFQGNLIDFCHHEKAVAMNQNKKILMAKDFKEKMTNYQKLVNHFTAAAKQSIVRHIQGQMTTLLLQATRITSSGRSFSLLRINDVQLATDWLNSTDLVHCLKVMTQIGKQKITRETAAITLATVNLRNSEEKKSNTNILVSALQDSTLDFLEPSQEAKESNTEEQVVDSTVALLNFLQEQCRHELKRETKDEGNKKLKKTNRKTTQAPVTIEIPQCQFAVHPEIDPDTEKYKVCFECGRKPTGIFYRCPKCQLVYFCSIECNRANLKKDTLHKCAIFFYGDEAARVKDEKEQTLQKQYSEESLEKTSRHIKVNIEERDKAHRKGDQSDIDTKKSKRKKKTEAQEKESDIDSKKRKKEKHKGKGAKHNESEDSDTDDTTATKKEGKQLKQKETDIDQTETDEPEDTGKESQGKSKKKGRKYTDESDDGQAGKKKSKKKHKGQQDQDESSNESEYGERRKKRHEGKKKSRGVRDEDEDYMGKIQKKTGKDKDEDYMGKIQKKTGKDKDYMGKIQKKTGKDKDEDQSKGKGKGKGEGEGEDKDKGKDKGEDKDKGKDQLKDKKSKHMKEQDELELEKQKKRKFGGHNIDERFPEKYQDFLLYVSGSAATGLDLDHLLLPYTVLRDGNLYYRLYGPKPQFIENYSLN